MDDDFNTSAAVRELFELLRALNRHLDTDGEAAALVRGAGVLRELSSLLGLFRAPPAREGAGDPAQLSGLVELLIEVREAARASRDFATADRIRDRLAELGIALEDRPDGTGWRRG